MEAGPGPNGAGDFNNTRIESLANASNIKGDNNETIMAFVDDNRHSKIDYLDFDSLLN